MRISNCLILLALLCLFSCGEAPKQPVDVSKGDMKSSMEKANRYLVNDEEKEIESYVARHNLAMVSTGTGLRYVILKQGSDTMLKEGERVSMEYQLCSIAGDVIYSSENEGIKTFVIGDGTVESGLDEAMKHLHRGDLAKLVIPSHLAYGLHGDDNRIPEYATLVYTVKIIENQ